MKEENLTYIGKGRLICIEVLTDSHKQLFAYR